MMIVRHAEFRDLEDIYKLATNNKNQNLKKKKVDFVI